MKKILTFAIIFVFGAAVSFAQVSTSAITNTTTQESVQVASPVVKAVDVNVSAEKCTTTGKSCCMGANKTAAITGSTSTETSASETTDPKKSCQQVNFGMSAAKPGTEAAADPEK